MLQALCEDPPVDGGSPSQRVSNTEGVSVSCATASQLWHYIDVITTTVASQITSLTSVYSIVYSGADQRKHQSSASLAFMRGIHRGPVNSPHKGPVKHKMFPFHDVIRRLNSHKTPNIWLIHVIWGSICNHCTVSNLPCYIEYTQLPIERTSTI